VIANSVDRRMAAITPGERAGRSGSNAVHLGVRAPPPHQYNVRNSQPLLGTADYSAVRTVCHSKRQRGLPRSILAPWQQGSA
jgi:hypothetical protein